MIPLLVSSRLSMRDPLAAIGQLAHRTGVVESHGGFFECCVQRHSVEVLRRQCSLPLQLQLAHQKTKTAIISYLSCAHSLTICALSLALLPAPSPATPSTFRKKSPMYTPTTNPAIDHISSCAGRRRSGEFVTEPNETPTNVSSNVQTSTSAIT